MAGRVSVKLAGPEYRQIVAVDDALLRAVAATGVMRESWRSRESPRVRCGRAVSCRGRESACVVDGARRCQTQIC